MDHNILRFFNDPQGVFVFLFGVIIMTIFSLGVFQNMRYENNLRADNPNS